MSYETICRSQYFQARQHEEEFDVELRKIPARDEHFRTAVSGAKQGCTGGTDGNPIVGKDDRCQWKL